MSAGVCRCYHRLVKNKVCLANIAVLIQKGGYECVVVLPFLNSSLVGEQRQAFSDTVEKSCHGEISHNSDETNYFIAEINHECRNGREWRLG